MKKDTSSVKMSARSLRRSIISWGNVEKPRVILPRSHRNDLAQGYAARAEKLITGFTVLLEDDDDEFDEYEMLEDHTKWGNLGDRTRHWEEIKSFVREEIWSERGSTARSTQCPHMDDLDTRLGASAFSAAWY